MIYSAWICIQPAADAFLNQQHVIFLKTFQVAKSRKQKGAAAAPSVWDDDDDDNLLLCAEAVDPTSRSGKASQKRVSKISALASNLDRMKKVKLEPGKKEEENQFPDDDALFSGPEVWPDVKQEVTSQPLASEFRSLQQQKKKDPKSQASLLIDGDPTHIEKS